MSTRRKCAKRHQSARHPGSFGGGTVVAQGGRQSQLAERAQFIPSQSAVFAGALKYTEYSWLKRALMKQIAKREGASQDASRDHEYTCWRAVDAFADGFAAYVEKATPAAAVA